MLTPFTSEPRLSSQFPNSAELRAALPQSQRAACEVVARLWLTEGIPSAFLQVPAVYEDLRGWLASRLTIHPKEVTVIGSARIGYSLAPPPDFGRPFNARSDLDLSVVSDQLFRRTAAEFASFSDDYASGGVTPRTLTERHIWEENIKFGSRNTPRGFLDPRKVPNFAQYPVARLVSQTMWALVKRLELTAAAPRVQRASIRVYRDWHSFVRRVTLNLMAAVSASAPRNGE